LAAFQLPVVDVSGATPPKSTAAFPWPIVSAAIAALATLAAVLLFIAFRAWRAKQKP
jgi:hypothetical protein